MSNQKSFPQVLITGGCGFIGVNFIRHLLQCGFGNLRILDNLSTGTEELLEDALAGMETSKSTAGKGRILYECFRKDGGKSRIDLMVGDIRTHETCLSAVEGMDAVVHLAAHAGVVPSIQNPFFDCEVNVLGTLNMLDAAVKMKVDRFILASSNAPLGNQVPPMNEAKAPKPLSPYGASKLSCEGYGAAFYGSYGLKTVALRFSNVYGPFCLHKDSVVSKMIKDGFAKRVLTVFGDGTQTRDFLYVEELCSVISSLLLTVNFPEDPAVWGEVFHLGTGEETSIIHLASMIRDHFQQEIRIVHEPERKGEIKRNYSDISKVTRLVSYKKGFPLEQGVKATFDWLKNKIVEKE